MKHVLILFGVFVAAFILFLVIDMLDRKPIVNIKSFEECVAAGNPVFESYPRQCRANGRMFVEVIEVPIVDNEATSTDDAASQSAETQEAAPPEE